ncbi:MAG TPA: GatB/YqeY domain-containing protein, partial [Candidatus Acidoferrum sp.]|nr:GatB/YqeY domain-containing protein [Candidatus Acidoferrum sp.]
PQALSEEEIRNLVTDAVSATGATSARDMGKVMGWLAPRTRGRADGKHVSELVVQALATADLAAHAGSHGGSGG